MNTKVVGELDALIGDPLVGAALTAESLRILRAARSALAADSFHVSAAASREILAAMRAYLPPGGISKDDFINRVLQAIDPGEATPLDAPFDELRNAIAETKPDAAIVHLPKYVALALLSSPSAIAEEELRGCKQLLNDPRVRALYVPLPHGAVLASCSGSVYERGQQLRPMTREERRAVARKARSAGCTIENTKGLYLEDDLRELEEFERNNPGSRPS